MNKVLLFILLTLVSCKTSHFEPSIEGKFINKGNDYYYSLILQNDYKFIYKQQDLEVLRLCYGKWHYINQNTIRIQCDEENTLQQLSTGYMIEREKDVIIVNHKKILIDKLLFKKIPSTK